MLKTAGRFIVASFSGGGYSSQRTEDSGTFSDIGGEKSGKQQRRVLTEEKLDEVGARLEHSPRKSLRRLAQEVNISKTSAFVATKLLKLKPYRLTVVHALRSQDPRDGATSHTARLLMEAVRQLFGWRFKSRNGDIPWPARSPDLSVCDFFLSRQLKSNVYRTRPATTSESG
ncbi:hypothetical protein ANN_25883 [Periplaneta americana]|uniref:Uncharacterized protein n=1 Tax=Periplaneta americana TaxID=6978 RepID=A0ABQ8S4R5_PERAM|nr:hypothetical protein ANN_25883 [Periplaneta americana]